MLHFSSGYDSNVFDEVHGKSQVQEISLMTFSAWKLFQDYNDQILPVNELSRESITLVRVLLESCGINVNRFYNELKTFLIHQELLYFAGLRLGFLSLKIAYIHGLIQCAD